MQELDNDSASAINTNNGPSSSSAGLTPEKKAKLMEKIMNAEDDDELGEKDICRVCRLSGNGTLYHPCLCTGSIKYVHQDCLMQWLKYSKKEVCELCNHKFSFKALYKPDMPEYLPAYDIMMGISQMLTRFTRAGLTYLLVAFCWLFLVPVMASRIYRLVFSGIFSSLFSSRILQIVSLSSFGTDINLGFIVVTAFLCTFISLIWLRELIMNTGPADFLYLPNPPEQQQAQNAPANNQPQIAPAASNPNAFSELEVTSDNDDGTELMDAYDFIRTYGQENTNDVTDDSTKKEVTTKPDDNEPKPSTSNASDSTNIETKLDQSLPSNSAANFGPSTSTNPPQDRVEVANRNRNADDAGSAPRAQDAAPGNRPRPQPQQRQQQMRNAGGDAMDRIVDDLTWQRLFGLDGSFVFLEHVFWTHILNIVFIVVFLYWPSQIGIAVLRILGVEKLHYFELPISILAGYLTICVHSLGIHQLAKILRMRKLYTMTGLVCIMLKVFLLVIIEVIIYPIMCGWWLDVCALPLTGATLSSRITSFQNFPASSTFLHWLAGMIYIFYSASFILVLRELLRPGVLWFVRNLNDPDFNPIQEMIEQHVQLHIQRLIASITLFFTIILLIVYVPLQLTKWIFPGLLPYSFSGSVDSPLVEYSFELILLQVVLPSILENSKAFLCMKKLVCWWCRTVGGWLGLESYLLSTHRLSNANRNIRPQRNAALEAMANANAALARAEAGQEIDDVRENGNIPNGVESDNDETLSSSSSENENETDVEVNEQNPENPPPAQAQDARQVADENEAQPRQVDREQNHLAARHHALLLLRDPTPVETYERPNFFALRIIALLLCLSITLTICSFILCTIPVSIGRLLLAKFAPINQPAHDLYTISVGFYCVYLVCRFFCLAQKWVHEGWTYFKRVVKTIALLVLRVVAAAIPIVGVIPFLLGLYFQLLVIGPLRISISQTPLFFPWKEWAMGVVHFKILCAFLLMGPDWWLKASFEEIYTRGIWNFRLKDVYVKLVFPIVNALCFLITFPYVVAKIGLLFVRASNEEQVVFTRYVYPIFMAAFVVLTFLIWQWNKLKVLALRIRNEKYLVGTELINFHRAGSDGIEQLSSAEHVVNADEARQVAAGLRND